MDHRPFENWLLENKDLTCNEKRELTSHLQACRSCSALAEVNLALKTVRQAAPAEGFTQRFQAQLVARKKALRLRNFWGFLILTVSVVSVLTWFGWPVLQSLAHSPVNILASWLTTLFSLWAAVQAMFQAGSVAVKVIPGFVPQYIWAMALFIAGGWIVLWVFSLMKITKVTRGVS
jgi:hypothetical protein